MRLSAFAAFTVLFLIPQLASADSNWPGWRGPRRDGHALESGFPIEWNDNKVAWKSELPGSGQSTPIIWESRIFLTASLEDGRERVVLCVDRANGDILWQTSVWKGEPESAHRMNGWASSTCATDGESVYAFFGQGGGLFCLSMEGDERWSRPLGAFPGPWGTAACPLLTDGLVILNCDSESKTDACLLAVDAATGETAWRTPRENKRGWSSPILVEANGRREIVLQGETGVRAYDPAKGTELWFTTGTRGRGTPTVTPAHGLLYVIPGRGGEAVALKPGGSGDVSATAAVWKTPRKGRDLPSPIVVGDYLLIVSHRGGILTCYDAKSGEELWQERIGGNFSASPVSFDSVAAFISDEGEVVFVKPGPKAEIVSSNRVNAADDEIFRASITPSKGQLFVRSTKVLYCLGE